MPQNVTTDSIREGLRNLYWSKKRFDAAFAKAMLELPVQGGAKSDGDAIVEVSISATENIPEFAPVTSKGKVADSANASQSMGRVIGIAREAIADGFSGVVIESGEVTNPGWAWAIGDLLFLNGTSIANSPPESGFVQFIGSAKSPTTIVVDLGPPTLL